MKKNHNKVSKYVPTTDQDTLNQLREHWTRIRIDMLLLLWLTELAGKRQKFPNSDEAMHLNAVEKNFIEFCKKYKQTTDFRIDRLGGLISLISSINIGLLESLNKLTLDDQNKVKDKFHQNFGSYDTQVKNYKIQVSSMYSKDENSNNHSALTLIYRIRNSLSHSRFDISNDQITLRDQSSNGQNKAEFSFTNFEFLNYSYQISRAILKALEYLNILENRK